ncbi:M48 family metallopeptidase, partial [Magnetococcales bacterium HHB-1]
KKVILCVATPKVILRTEEDQQDRYAKDLYQCAIEDVRLQPRIGQAPRSILFPDGSLCLVEDHQMVERLFPTKSRQGESMHQLESHTPLFITIMLLLIAFIGSSVLWGIPYLVKKTAQAIPQEMTIPLGKNGLNTLVNTFNFNPTKLLPERQEEIRKAAQKIAEHVNLTTPLHISFYQGGETLGANALALPGGFLLITDEIIAKIDGSNEALQALLAHEIAHITKKHGLQSLLNQSLFALLLINVTGDVSLTGLSVTLLHLKHSHAFEHEADIFATQFMKQQQKPIEPFIVLLQKLTEKDDEIQAKFDWLSTHPTTEKRAEKIRDCFKFSLCASQYSM